MTKSWDKLLFRISIGLFRLLWGILPVHFWRNDRGHAIDGLRLLLDWTRLQHPRSIKPWQSWWQLKGFLEDLGRLTPVTKVVLLLLWTEHISVSRLSSIITTPKSSSVSWQRITQVDELFTTLTTPVESTYCRFPRICVVFSKEKLVFLCRSTISVSACFGSTGNLYLTSYSLLSMSLPLTRFFS